MSLQVYRILARLAIESSADYHFKDNSAFKELGLEVEEAFTCSRNADYYVIWFTFKNGNHTQVEVTSTFENFFKLNIRHPMSNPQLFEKLPEMKFLREMRKILLREIEQVTES